MASSGLVRAPERPVKHHPFDTAASSYDAVFTDTPLGRWYRNQVWKRLAESFKPGDHVFDLGCGTGEDAIWLAQRGVRVTAIDASPVMLEVARQKAARSNCNERIDFHHLDLTVVGAHPLFRMADGSGARFDGAYSNFGPLNCVEGRRRLGTALASVIKPGGRLVLVVMGALCPWEIIWHVARFEFRTAFRRLRSGASTTVGGDSLNVWYPSITTLEDDFRPSFQAFERVGLGLLVPPSAMDRLVRRAPRLFNKLAVIDRHAGHLRPWLWLNDHYLLVLERRTE